MFYYDIIYCCDFSNDNRLSSLNSVAMMTSYMMSPRALLKHLSSAWLTCFVMIHAQFNQSEPGNRHREGNWIAVADEGWATRAAAQGTKGGAPKRKTKKSDCV